MVTHTIIPLKMVNPRDIAGNTEEEEEEGIQGCHWTFAKITENLRVRAVSQKMNTERDRKVRKRKMK